MRNLKITPLYDANRENTDGPRPALFDGQLQGELWLVGWVEAEPSATFEGLFSSDGLQRFSQIMHPGAAVPVKRQEQNQLFALYTKKPVEAGEARA